VLEGQVEVGGPGAGQRLDLGDLHRGEPRRAAGAATVGEPGQSLAGEPDSPRADGVGIEPQIGGDLDVRRAVGGREHDRRALPVAARCHRRA
jgi:hypothetical protein